METVQHISKNTYEAFDPLVMLSINRDPLWLHEEIGSSDMPRVVGRFRLFVSCVCFHEAVAAAAAN